MQRDGRILSWRIDGGQRQKTAEVWRRWRAGESLRTIAPALACTHRPSPGCCGGRGADDPPARRRARRVLTSGDREEIARGVAAGLSCGAIGRRIGRPRCTVTREVQRHGGPTNGHANPSTSEHPLTCWPLSLHRPIEPKAEPRNPGTPEPRNPEPRNAFRNGATPEPDPITGSENRLHRVGGDGEQPPWQDAEIEHHRHGDDHAGDRER